MTLSRYGYFYRADYRQSKKGNSDTMQLKFRLLFMLAALTMLGSAQRGMASTELANLPKPVQDEISRLCLPVQYREGATAYRNCVTAEIELRSADTGSPMAQLSFDDKYAVQQACAKAGSESPDQYRSCINEQIVALQREPVPVLNNLSDDELYAVQQTCFPAQARQGAGEYRRCVNQELDKLLQVQRVNLGELSVLQRNALQLRCSAISTDAAGYRQCLADESGLPASQTASSDAGSSSDADANVTAGTTATRANNNAESNLAAQPAAPAETSKETETGVQAQPTAATLTSSDADADVQIQSTPAVPGNATAIRDPAANATLNDSAATAVAPTDSIEFPTDQESLTTNQNNDDVLTPLAIPQAPTEVQQDSEAGFQAGSDEEPGMVSGILTSITALQQRAVDGFSSLNEYGRLLLAAILALPLLLVAWVVFKRKRRSRYELPMDRPVMQPAPAFDDDDGFDLARFQAQRAAEEPTRTVRLDRAEFAAKQAREAPDTAVTRIATKPTLREPQPDPAQNKSSGNLSGFGKWLEQQPQGQRLQSCVEFLIYWMAYGDERYDPAMKRKLFLARDLNNHDLIKRWVLKRDANAFADVITWTRLHATAVQLEQIVDLLMALLVTPNSVTPVQTTLLRFLGDVFGMGSEVLEGRFERAFGHHLPGVPRVDKLAWWQKLTQQQIDRWEAPFLTKIPEREQLKARLGLDDDFSEADVVQAFRRAARRCHPDCFNALDEQERMLAARQFTKFEEARDRLLGVSV